MATAKEDSESVQAQGYHLLVLGSCPSSFQVSSKTVNVDTRLPFNKGDRNVPQLLTTVLFQNC